MSTSIQQQQRKSRAPRSTTSLAAAAAAAKAPVQQDAALSRLNVMMVALKAIAAEKQPRGSSPDAWDEDVKHVLECLDEYTAAQALQRSADAVEAADEMRGVAMTCLLEMAGANTPGIRARIVGHGGIESLLLLPVTDSAKVAEILCRLADTEEGVALVAGRTNVIDVVTAWIENLDDDATCVSPVVRLTERLVSEDQTVLDALRLRDGLVETVADLAVREVCDGEVRAAALGIVATLARVQPIKDRMTSRVQAVARLLMPPAAAAAAAGGVTTAPATATATAGADEGALGHAPVFRTIRCLISNHAANQDQFIAVLHDPEYVKRLMASNDGAMCIRAAMNNNSHQRTEMCKLACVRAALIAATNNTCTASEVSDLACTAKECIRRLCNGHEGNINRFRRDGFTFEVGFVARADAPRVRQKRVARSAEADVDVAVAVAVAKAPDVAVAVAKAPDVAVAAVRVPDVAAKAVDLAVHKHKHKRERDPADDEDAAVLKQEVRLLHDELVDLRRKLARSMAGVGY